MIVWSGLGFDGTKTRIKAGNRAALLLSFLGHLGANALKGIANWCVDRGNVLVAVINFDRGVVVQCVS